MDNTILLYAALLMGILGIVLGVIIAVFVKLFSVKSDPRVDLALELLPGANCGGCGKAGCADFAKVLAAGEVQPANCPVSSSEQIAAISLALGIDAGEVERMQAVVCCRSDIGEVRKMNYNGVQDCVAANMVAGGPDECRYGCLGLGTCARKCPFGAIEIIGQVAVVHRELCVGCGKCAAACPRGVIKLVPADSEYHIYCNSPEKGANKRHFCKAGCIGCRKCEKLCGSKFKLSGFLSQVNYADGAVVSGEEVRSIHCPVGCLLSVEERLEAAYNKVKGNKK
ncbi:MAG: RnfABCDGE type electron transport complex subunit B [Lentisphaeria bacterium]|nr:RnfABCDGE type electron transport complex subunit B [Lentisphaeria bacterium]